MVNFVTKKILVSATVVSLLTSIAAIAYAETTLKQISAYQNADIKIENPIIYEGHSYVSAKAVAEGLGANVQWDDVRKTVVITPAGQTPLMPVFHLRITASQLIRLILSVLL